ncbi:MAG: hypothetical protein ABEJ31_03230 [Haloarculaceae archaeon]
MSTYWTTIRLTRAGDTWTATQRGVDVTGTGETAQRAAADYCERLARRHESADDAGDAESAEAAPEETESTAAD